MQTLYNLGPMHNKEKYASLRKKLHSLQTIYQSIHVHIHDFKLCEFSEKKRGHNGSFFKEILTISRGHIEMQLKI